MLEGCAYRHWAAKVAEAEKASQDKAAQLEKQWQDRQGQSQNEWQGRLRQRQVQWAQDRAAAEQAWRDAKAEAEQQWQQQLDALQHTHRWGTCISALHKLQVRAACIALLVNLLSSFLPQLQPAQHGLRGGDGVEQQPGVSPRAAAFVEACLVQDKPWCSSTGALALHATCCYLLAQSVRLT